MSTVERIMGECRAARNERTDEERAHDMRLAIATCMVVLMIGMFIGALLENVRAHRAAARSGGIPAAAVYLEQARGDWP